MFTLYNYFLSESKNLTLETINLQSSYIYTYVYTYTQKSLSKKVLENTAFFVFL